jgi:hypothetical protein
MALKTGGVEFERGAFEERLLARAAGRMVGKSFLGQPVDRVAMRADDMERCVHDH